MSSILYVLLLYLKHAKEYSIPPGWWGGARLAYNSMQVTSIEPQDHSSIHTLHHSHTTLSKQLSQPEVW